MLEQPSLLMRPWQAASSEEPDGMVRAVLDAAGDTVGFVRQLPLHGPRWLRWLGRRTLDVYEAPDDSLVFSLRRTWGWPAAWQVVDADGRLVGKLAGRALRDGFGQLLAVIEMPGSLDCGRFLARDGSEVGSYSLAADGTRVSFAAGMQGNPFAKMMLLGAVLCYCGARTSPAT